MYTYYIYNCVPIFYICRVDIYIHIYAIHIGSIVKIWKLSLSITNSVTTNYIKTEHHILNGGMTLYSRLIIGFISV